MRSRSRLLVGFLIRKKSESASKINIKKSITTVLQKNPTTTATTAPQISLFCEDTQNQMLLPLKVMEKYSLLLSNCITNSRSPIQHHLCSAVSHHVHSSRLKQTAEGWVSLLAQL